MSNGILDNERKKSLPFAVKIFATERVASIETLSEGKLFYDKT